jgi:hypothetical protein
MDRLGYTETTLLFYFYLDSLNINNKNYINSQNSLINWLCSTSGYYDKNIKGNYFNFNPIHIKQTKIYNEYFTQLLYIVKNTNNNLLLCFHNIDDNLLNYKEQFLDYLNYKNKNKSIDMLSFITNKDLLIINNLGSLMKTQYESGNITKINPKFPQVKSIQYLENGYTFCNDGSNNNILETINILCDKIKEYEFDCAIISAGAYSCFLANYINNTLKKEAFIIRGSLPSYFGIITKRTQPNNQNEYYITVPEELKPKNYMKIEKGCYW